MIGSAFDTSAFSEITPDERFRADPPPSSSLLATNSMEITYTDNGPDAQPIELEFERNVTTVEETLDEIVAKCKRSVAKYPESSRSHMNLGLALMRKGDVEEGLTVLRQAASLDKGDYLATSLLAAALCNAGEQLEAEQLYRQIAERFPSSVAGYMGLASIALHRNAFDDAEARLRHVLHLEPKMATASFSLAMIHLRLDRPKQAISVLRKALFENASSPELNHGMAIAYLSANEPQKAEKFFHTAIALNPKLSSALHGLAILWLRENRTSEVVELLSRRLEGNPDDLESRELLAQAHVGNAQFRQARGQLSIILQTLTSLTVRDTDEIARIINSIAYCYANEGNLKEAEVRINEAIELDSTRNPTIRENLARLYVLQGNPERALIYLDKTLHSNIGSPSMLMLRESCLVILGRYEDAIVAAFQLVSRNDAPMEAYAELGWLLCEWREDFAGAIAVLKVGLDKWSDSALILNNLAYAHLMLGELSAAKALLAAITDDGKNAMYVTATRGLLALFEGNVELGESLYDEAEDIARKLANQGLVLAIRQKKYLEIGRALLRLGDEDGAQRYIDLGLRIKSSDKRFPFAKQLARIGTHMDRRLLNH